MVGIPPASVDVEGGFLKSFTLSLLVAAALLAAPQAIALTLDATNPFTFAIEVPDFGPEEDRNGERYAITEQVRLDEIAAEFEATGGMTVPIRGEWVTLDLRERDIYAPGGRFIYGETHDGEGIIGYVTARTFVGKVANDYYSHAAVTLDEVTLAFLGTVHMDERRIHVTSEPGPDGTAYVTTSWTDTVTAPPREHHHSPTDNHRTTTIRPFSDSSYRAAHPDWSAHITSVFNLQHSMWDDDVAIHQSIASHTAITGWTETDCSTHLASFRDYVDVRIDSGAYTQDAFQMFTGANLATCNGMAYAQVDPWTLTLGEMWASSIVESVDHTSGGYDPDIMHHLAIVSAQEIGHNYGEEDHPQDQRCEDQKWWGCADWSYNAMAAGTDYDERNYWFTQGTQDRIEAEAYPQL